MIDPLFGYQLAALCFLLFALLGAFDGIYFHMYKYRLYEHPPAKFEHQLHTFRGIIFIPITILFFVLNSIGALLWLGITLLIIDFIAEIVDILIEKEARKDIGGISSIESVIHITATGFRMAALAIIVSLKPIEAFAWNAPTAVLPLPGFIQILGILFVAGLLLALLVQSLIQTLPALKRPKFRSCCRLQQYNLC